VALTWWEELFRWGSTTPVVGLNDASHVSEQWGSTAPQVVPIEANIQLSTRLRSGSAGQHVNPEKVSPKLGRKSSYLEVLLSLSRYHRITQCINTNAWGRNF
jgi:hypothetical protein